MRGKFVGSMPDTQLLLNMMSLRYIGRDYPGTPSPDNLVLKFKPEKVNTFTRKYE